MKHQSARIKTKITSYTNEGKNIKTHISSTDVQPEIDRYNVDGNTLSGTATSAVSATSNVFTVAENAVTASPYVQTIERESDYQYFLPQTDGSKLTLSFESGSKIYGKDLSSKTLNLSALGILDKNGSYTVNVKLKTFPYYLYHDGTVGTIGDKGTREPIGIVLTEKTTTEKGLAIALKDAGTNIPPATYEQYYNYWISDNSGIDNMHGYDLTYTTNYYRRNPDGSFPTSFGTKMVAKVESPSTLKEEGYSDPYFPTYYAAAHYNPGVTITGNNVGKWFLGSSGQWVLMCEKLGKLNKATIPSNYASVGGGGQVSDFASWNGVMVQSYFTQAGGTLPLSMLYSVSGSTTGNSASSSNTYGGFPIFIYLKDTGVGFGYDFFVTITYCSARAFVHF